MRESHTSVTRLMGDIIALQADIHETQCYLNCPVATDGAISLPLGIMGQIMVQQLETESNVLADNANLILLDDGDSWEMAQHSSFLHKKVSLLITLSDMITQLPYATPITQAIARHLLQRVTERCYRMERLLEAMISAAIVVSNPVVAGHEHAPA